MPEDVRIKFIPFNTQLAVPNGTSILKAINRSGYPVGSACRGQGVCTACLVWVHGAVSSPCSLEIELLKRVSSVENRGEFRPRIACLARITGCVSVTADYW